MLSAQPIAAQTNIAELIGRLTATDFKRDSKRYYVQAIAYGTAAVLVSPFSREESKALLDLCKEKKGYARSCYNLYRAMKRGVSEPPMSDGFPPEVVFRHLSETHR